MLADHHAAQLRASAISEALASERGYVTVPDPPSWRQYDVTGQMPDRQMRVPGLAFPVFRLGADAPYCWILRPDTPRWTKGENPKPIKYEWPKGVAPCLDLLPSARARLNNPAVPIWITEGAKKADALASAFGDAIVAINLNGVWGWRGTSSTGGKLVLPDLDEIAWNGRAVVLAFDSDVVRKRPVLTALQRFAAVLATRGAESQVLLLPQHGDDKTGVDDYLAAGHGPAELAAHLVPLAHAVAAGREKLFAHPETGVDLYLPAGYLATGGMRAIARLNERGQAYEIYAGGLAVTATGVDLSTATQTMTVRWNGRPGHHGEVTAPRAELARAKGVIEHMAAQGAAVHEGNARDIARYLVEFAHENDGALPQRAHMDRLGLVGEGVLLPAGGVGFDQDVTYVGRAPVRVGSDANAYGRVLRDALQWDGAWVFWAVLGLSLASPAIARLRPRRNPACYIAGESGSGKTTVCQFATGAWGDPTRSPLLVQAQRTTPAGYFQTLEHLNGIPLFVDEAHTAPDPAKLEAIAYQFANGETYTRGGVDGKARGGETLGGALLLAGEALPEFRHAGSVRRVLWIDGTLHTPLGAGTVGPAGSGANLLGKRRAQQLEAAWDAGAGLFGKAVVEAIWRDWGAFSADCAALATDVALEPLQAWRPTLAIAAAALNVGLRVAGCADAAPPDFGGQLLDRWAELLTTGHETSDPAVDAWERLVVFLAQADVSAPALHPGWQIAYAARSRALIACKRDSEEFWRVLVGTDEFIERIGKSAVQLHGRAWLRRGWLLERNGKPTAPDCLPNGSTARVLRIPLAALHSWHE